LVRVERMMENASRALATVPPAGAQRGAGAEREGAVASASGETTPVRGD
jgi:ribosomal protein L12E/L44/L45/RPP1/RPP2